ncbi:MAG TPA: YbdK family carboxylate-amine ligase [Solirubrobacteraceae bacterium]|nr:YbdK family carboxylate-amine ligase [Solirubrobacteraceae bacterium]
MSAIDLDLAEAAFESSVDGTVGIEEEFAILDPESLDMVPRFEELRDSAAEDPALAVSIAGELISSEIEIRSGAGSDLHDAMTRQNEVRRRLFALAEAHGVALGATGTHPWADYRAQRNIDTEHYRRVVEGLQYVARRNNTFALHVHVGVHGAEHAVQACDRLRPVLPALLAISANSPFLEGCDAGLHSVRTQTFTKSFPRCGVPDAYGSWAVYRDYLEFLVSTGSIVEDTQVWWSIRPHLAFGTVEVRICDVQMTAHESDALSGLIVACVLQAARDAAEGVPSEPPPPRLIEENMWRAIRFGREAGLIDLSTGAVRPVEAVLDRLLAWTAPVRAEAQIEPVLPERNGAQRQLELRGQGAGLPEIYASTVTEARRTYGRAGTTQEAPAP